MRLYELPAAFAELLSRADELGELPPDAAALLDALELDVDGKAAGICRLIRGQEVIAASIRVEAGKLVDKARVIERQAEWWKAYLLKALLQIGRDSAGDGAFKARVGHRASIDVDVPAEQLPEEFRRVKIEPDKTALTDAAKAGQELPPGVRYESHPFLAIK